MKKLFISMSVLALVFASCGDASSEASSSSAVCDCMDGQVKMLKDQLNGMSEEDAEAKYADMMEKCLKMGEGKSESELEALNKEAEACPAAKEIKKLEEELYDKMMSEMDMDMDMDMDME